jgi:hypothetical protein
MTSILNRVLNAIPYGPKSAAVAAPTSQGKVVVGSDPTRMNQKPSAGSTKNLRQYPLAGAGAPQPLTPALSPNASTGAVALYPKTSAPLSGIGGAFPQLSPGAHPGFAGP